ncbi:MAG: aminoacyl-tRNA hydrolase [Candidatus Krumholzibacteriia bacterium]
MRLIVGLGNPGEGYAATRHNLGARAVEAFAQRHGLALREADPAYRLAAGVLPGGPVVLLVPLTFMNRSAEALARWAGRHGVRLGLADAPDGAGREPGDRPPLPAPPGPSSPPPVVPLVVCDDLALPLGALRLRARGGAGGHRGLESIIALLGGEGFPRLRLGVAGADGPPDPAGWADYVLAPFAAEEEPAVAALVADAAAALEGVVAGGLAAAAARFNRGPGGPAG